MIIKDRSYDLTSKKFKKNKYEEQVEIKFKIPKYTKEKFDFYTNDKSLETLKILINTYIAKCDAIEKVERPKRNKYAKKDELKY